MNNRPNTKDEIISYLLQQFPSLNIELQLTGHVLNMDENIVYTRVYTEKDEEYDCEFSKNLFPLKDLSDNISFYLISGNINKQEFIHINYFYWTQEQIDSAKEKAKELSDFFLDNNLNDDKKA